METKDAKAPKTASEITLKESLFQGKSFKNGKV